MIAVITPTGSSVGAMTTLERVSATSSNMAPARADAGSKCLWSGPINMRTICGTTNPTKAIVPTMATDVPTPMATQMIMATFTFECVIGVFGQACFRHFDDLVRLA